MPTITTHPISLLKIDQQNYRTVSTLTEIEAVHVLIALRPHYFWDLTRSLLENGYDGTENIVVMKTGPKKDLVVREGNRRVGALKIIHGIFPLNDFDVPEDIENAIETLDSQWKTTNAAVPCSVFEEKDADTVKRLVARTHARGETAGRLNWEAVARARYNRNEFGGSEPGLDLLEAYLKTAKKLTEEDRERWGGDYPLTILDEALQKIATRLGIPSARGVVDEALKTPALQKLLGTIIHDIGTDTLKTRELRSPSWGPTYKLPVAPTSKSAAPTVPTTLESTVAAGSIPGAPPASTAVPTVAASTTTRVLKTLSLSDPQSVRRELRKLTPKGKSSSKVVDLLFEAKKLKLEQTPICFCLLLRSMFEISVRDYCSANKIPFNKIKNGKTKEKSLSDLLVDAGNHVISKSSDPTIKGLIRAASIEIKNPHGVLSIPVMNALVHSPTATITSGHIVVGFHKIFPLLVAISK